MNYIAIMNCSKKLIVPVNFIMMTPLKMLQLISGIISTHWRSGLLLCCFHQLLEHSVKFTPLK